MEATRSKLYKQPCGDICAAEVTVGTRRCLLIAVYINPGASLRDVQYSLSYYITVHSPNIGQINRFLAAEGCHDMPIMLVGDFNLEVSTNENAAFLDFMHDMFGLRLASITAPTTIGGSCIDMAFIRNLDGLRCSRHISYFSYHRPLLAVYDYEYIESTQCSDLTQNK
jgi:endonuclease/exonuclease/phosphatase (EEP) superfamily protein YafD